MSSTSLGKQTLFSDNWKVSLAWLLGFAAILIFAGIGLRGAWPADEPRFVDVAREMVDTGQWFFPARGEEYYPDKPPVFMWLIAVFYLITGNIEVAGLLPNAICSLITLAAVFDIGRRVWGADVGRNAALLLLVTPQFIIQAKFAQIDAMVACWITLGCYGLLRHFMDGPNWKWYFIGWAFMGLGIITKGVGFLPLLMLIPLAIYHRYAKPLKGMWGKRAAAGPLAMLAVIGLWLVPMVIIVALDPTAEHIAYRNNILFRQTAERYVHSLGHVQPWYYFVVQVLPWFWLPLTFLALTKFKTIVANMKADPRLLVLVGWVALVVLFFSLSPGKRDVYILPALPMMCLAISAAWQGMQLNKPGSLVLRSLCVLVAVLLGVLAYGIITDHPKVLKALQGYDVDDQLAHQFSTALWAMAGLILAAVVISIKRSAWLAWGGMVSVVALVASFVVYPMINDLRTPRDLMANLEKTVGKDAQVGLVAFKEQFLLYSAMDLTHFSYLEPVDVQSQNAWLWMREKPNRYLLIPERANPSCMDESKAVSMGVEHRTHWLLYDIATMSDSCPAPPVIKRYHSPANKALTFGQGHH